MLWYSPAELYDPDPALLGILEVDERPGVMAIEMQLYSLGNTTLAVWLDEAGCLLRVARAASA